MRLNRKYQAASRPTPLGQVVETRSSAHRIEKTIVIPSYNEETRISSAFPRLLDNIDLAKDEIILVDDGSADGTLDLARELLSPVTNCTFIQLAENRGKGAAVRVGVSHAQGRLIAFVDADMASDPSGLTRLFGRLESCEVALGTRSHPESTINCRDPSRVLFGRVFNRLVRSITGLSVLDTQCGFKAFRAPAAQLLFHLSQIEGYAFDVEIIMLASKLSMRIGEVPVDWADIKGSHVRPLLDAAPMLADVMRSVATWRNSKPIEALTIQSSVNGARMGPIDVVSAMRSSLRYGDPIVTWPKGALCLLPALDHETATLIRQRLESKLPQCQISQSLVTANMLLHPSSAPMLKAIRAIPGPRDDDTCVVCDDVTAHDLLVSLGVA